MKRSLTIVGGGPAAMMLAASADNRKFDVNVYEKNSAPGRKFLVAGDGGLNITHAEHPDKFITRFTPRGFLDRAFSHFNNHHLIAWLQEAGIKTFKGSSGRVFPLRGIKPIDALSLLLEKVRKNNVQWHAKHEWVGWDENGDLLMKHNNQTIPLKTDLVVFALGGASWPVTGSDGSWTKNFEKAGVTINGFDSSNCTMFIEWPADVADTLAGKPLKNIVLSCGGREQKGEVVITASGLEGSGIYALSPQIRAQLQVSGFADLHLDLKPVFSQTEILSRLRRTRRAGSRTEVLRASLNLGAVETRLLKSMVTKEDFFDDGRLSAAVKNVNMRVTGMAQVEDAISTVGGIALHETDPNFMLKKLPGHYVIGEMLDYDAPTGGYLLQSCFTMGAYLSHILNSTS